MIERQETVCDVCAEMIETHKRIGPLCEETLYEWHDQIIATNERELAAKDAVIARLKHILKSSCRWIKCHDIYHTSGADILKEAKEILHDDGEFLFKKGE